MFTLALLLILLLLLLSAIDSAEGGTTLPPYLQRLPTRQEPKNERKKESSDARRRRHLKIKKDCVALCFLSRGKSGSETSLISLEKDSMDQVSSISPRPNQVVKFHTGWNLNLRPPEGFWFRLNSATFLLTVLHTGSPP